MKSISALRLGAALVLLQSTACISVNHTQTADTVGKGNLQLGVAPSYVRAVGDDSGDSGFLGGAQAQVLYGAQDTLDVGARVGYQRLVADGLGDSSFSGFGVDVLSKFQLLRKDTLRVALAPSLGFSHVGVSGSDVSSDGINAVQLQVPLLIGIPVGEHQLVVGPTVTDAVFFGGGDSSNALNVGATAGFALKIPNTSVRIMPEVGMLYPLVGTVPGEGSSFNDDGSFYLQFSLGFMFGGGGSATANEPSQEQGTDSGY
jgi:hypothetical protein